MNKDYLQHIIEDDLKVKNYPDKTSSIKNGQNYIMNSFKIQNFNRNKIDFHYTSKWLIVDIYFNFTDKL